MLILSSIISVKAQNQFYFSGGADVILKCLDRGSGGRALVHGPGNILMLNYANDFAGGTWIDSYLTVNGGLKVQKYGSEFSYNGGGDLILKCNGRGTGGRALVHFEDNKLVLNFANDFTGGVTVGSRLDVLGGVSTSGTNAGFRVFSGPDDNANQAPWYGVGLSNLILNGREAPAVQLAGFYGLNFQTAEGQMVMLNNGNVGIGEIAPKGKLDVNGTIRAREVVVTDASWSDFVFDKDYKLRDLKEVDQFIQDNGHLPEIPSAAEVKEKGVNLVEVQAKLLQKVEEMTLYLLAQEKKMKEMQSRIDKLESGKGN